VDEAFIIMQIGNRDLDVMCDKVLVPAITDAGFTARRVDRHNTGDLLKSEIVQFIERAQIIVADLTNERPNCYLEVGYAMGVGKKSNLILTAREDHYHGSPNYQRGGPKVHFDLEGYDILFWSLDDLAGFRAELTQRIARRASIVQAARPAAPVEAAHSPWWNELRSKGEAGLAGLDRAAYMEVAAEIRPPADWSQRTLRDALREAAVHTFGWPIGVILDNRDEYRPRPTADGIAAEIPIPGAPGMDRTSYDLWRLYRDGRFYTLLSLFEDERDPDAIFFDTRIVRVTEALLLLVRLYRRLDASDQDVVTVHIRHKGLAGRVLRAANRNRSMHSGRIAVEDVVEARVSAALIELETNLSDYVGDVVGPLFMLFDFFELSDEVVADISNGFIQGEVR
jgi:hypothetical protein